MKDLTAVTSVVVDLARISTGAVFVNGVFGEPIPSNEQPIEIQMGQSRVYKVSSPPFYTMEQDLRVTGNPNVFSTPSEWEDYIREAFPSSKAPFEDFAFDIEKLVSKNITTTGGRGALYGDVEFMYNYYNRAYEFLQRFPQVPEAILPNIYVNFAVDADVTDPFFMYLMTAFGRLPINEAKVNSSLAKNPDEEDAANETHQQWNNRSKAISAMTAFQRADLAARFSNIIFPMENMDILKEMEEYISLWPMINKIEFRTDSRTEFAQILKDSKLSSSLLKYISVLLHPIIIDDTIDETGKSIVSKPPAADFFSRYEMDIGTYNSKEGGLKTSPGGIPAGDSNIIPPPIRREAI